MPKKVKVLMPKALKAPTVPRASSKVPKAPSAPKVSKGKAPAAILVIKKPKGGCM